MSVCWKAYSDFSQYNYTHQTVNHSFLAEAKRNGLEPIKEFCKHAGLMYARTEFTMILKKLFETNFIIPFFEIPLKIQPNTDSYHSFGINFIKKEKKQ